MKLTLDGKFRWWLKLKVNADQERFIVGGVLANDEGVILYSLDCLVDYLEAKSQLVAEFHATLAVLIFPLQIPWIGVNDIVMHACFKGILS